MQAIILVCADGARHLAFVTDIGFDVQAWANSRREAFALLQIVKVEIQEAERK